MQQPYLSPNPYDQKGQPQGYFPNNAQVHPDQAALGLVNQGQPPQHGYNPQYQQYPQYNQPPPPTVITVNRQEDDSQRCAHCRGTGFITKNTIGANLIIWSCILLVCTGWMCFIPCLIDDCYDK